MKKLLTMLPIVALLGCSGSTPVINPATLVTDIQLACNFNTTLQAVQAVIASFAGPGGALPAAIATQVENAICAAVNAQVPAIPPTASAKLDTTATSGIVGTAPVLKLVVNGVTITGTYTK
jgi:hypothetical protein